MKYVEGDLFKHILKTEHVYAKGELVTIIPHVCNTIGAWGAGFVIPLANHFPEARESYLSMKERPLANTVLISPNDDILIANMIAQEGVGPTFKGKGKNQKMIPPIRYEALETCMLHVQEAALHMQKEGKKPRIACPMFGAGLAGGDWPKIEGMIRTLWSEKGIPTTIYYLPQFLPPGWTPPKGEV